MIQVSVIIPTYNRREYVQEAIDTVLAQTYPDYEIIVVDDGSTDGTGEALATRYGDRIRYVWQENQGESVTRNRGIEMARGRFVAFLDSDDLWQPKTLAKLVGALEATPEAVLAYGRAWLVDESGRRLGSHLLNGERGQEDLPLASLCLENRVGPPSTVLVRREYLDAVGGFDPAIHYGEDWDLWLRLRREGPFICLAEPLASIRAHSGSQCHYPRPETVDQKLRDHLRLLTKVFDRWEKAPDGLRERALAGQYAEVAFVDYAIGRPASGHEKLREAARLDPHFYGDLQELSEQFTDKILGIASVRREAVRDTVCKTRVALQHWPAELPVSGRWKAKALSSLCASLMFKSYAAGDLAGTRYCLVRAIRYDHSWLADPGMWSIGAEASVGQEAADGLRTWFRRAFPRSPDAVPD